MNLTEHWPRSEAGSFTALPSHLYRTLAFCHMDLSQGFEPRFAGPKPAVLPLDEPRMERLEH